MTSQIHVVNYDNSGERWPAAAAHPASRLRRPLLPIFTLLPLSGQQHGTSEGTGPWSLGTEVTQPRAGPVPIIPSRQGAQCQQQDGDRTGTSRGATPQRSHAGALCGEAILFGENQG